jgi:hypothetical protein
MRAILFGTICLLTFSGCQEPVQFTEKDYVLTSGDSLYVSELKITIHNKGCGTKWISEKDRSAYEVPYCSLEIRQDNEQVQYLNNNEPVYAGEAEVRIGKINPWGRPQDSLPAYSCMVMVKKVAGTHR